MWCGNRKRNENRYCKEKCLVAKHFSLITKDSRENREVISSIITQINEAVIKVLHNSNEVNADGVECSNFHEKNNFEINDCS